MHRYYMNKKRVSITIYSYIADPLPVVMLGKGVANSQNVLLKSILFQSAHTRSGDAPSRQNPSPAGKICHTPIPSWGGLSTTIFPSSLCTLEPTAPNLLHSVKNVEP